MPEVPSIRPTTPPPQSALGARRIHTRGRVCRDSTAFSGRYGPVFGPALALALALLLVANAAGANNPLEPVDTSSPRATLESFLALTDQATELFSEYRRAPSPSLQAQIQALGDKGMRLLDLSQVPPIARREVGGEALFLLWDVLARVELPPLDEVPGGAEGVEGADQTALPKSWRIPNTEITLASIPEGPEAGEYRFTPNTVERARSLYDAAQGLPYRRPMPLGDVYRHAHALAGWMIPSAWLDALPAWAKAQLIDQVIWKWLAVLLLVSVSIGITILVFRWSQRRRSGGIARAHWVRLATPLVVALLAQLLLSLVRHQIIATGPIVEAMVFGIELITAGAAVWVFWYLLSWVAEDIIASPRINPQSLDAQLIRLAARTVGFLAILILVFHVMNQIGVPVYGLVASAGVGGIAVALAAKSTLENFMGALNLFADRPVRVGDLCRYDGDQSGGWRAVGKVESIGLRSVKIRKFDRSLITIPNAEFAQRDILNLSASDRFLLTTTLGLRYETTDDQLRFLLGTLRELLHAHPKAVHTIDDPLRVRFVGFGDYSLNVAIRAYIRTSSFNEFLAIQEDLLLRIMKLVEEAGTGFAFPSQTLYLSRDSGLDSEQQQAAEKQVREWAAAQSLPFPDLAEEVRKQVTNTLDYPPTGSPGADRG
ncbi:MAG: mechanosensitive ion channel family protein [Chromatiaceae bacterium]